MAIVSPPVPQEASGGSYASTAAVAARRAAPELKPKGNVGKVVLAAVAIVAVVGAIQNQDSTTSSTRTTDDAYAAVGASPTTSGVASRFTRSEENAIRSSESYLSFTAFSRSGLIDQLEYEGFTTSEATMAVDYLRVDWNEQAWKSAESYLSFMAFSRSGLIDQLEYEGFTTAQATYGVTKAGL